MSAGTISSPRVLAAVSRLQFENSKDWPAWLDERQQRGGNLCCTWVSIRDINKENEMPNYTTTDSKYSDLNGSMVRTGNNITSYTSTNLGAATNITNNNPPPLISCVVTFGNGAVYTICGRQNGTGFLGQAFSGSVACPTQVKRDDDWTATSVGEGESIPPKKAKQKSATRKKK
jgi:hypothetical protein